MRGKDKKMQSKDQSKLHSNDPAIASIISTTPEIAISDFESKFPKEDLWRLVVDGILYANMPELALQGLKNENGWVDYETREPGSLLGFLYGWTYCLDTLKTQPKHTSLTRDFIEELHRRVNINVKNLGSDEFRESADQGYFTFHPSCLHCYTKEGLGDLLNSIHAKKLKSARLLISSEALIEEKIFLEEQLSKISEPNSFNDLLKKMVYSKPFKNLGNDPDIPKIELDLVASIDILGIDSVTDLAWNLLQKFGLRYITPVGSDAKQLLDDNITHYNQQIIHAKSDEEKLKLIAKTIQFFERIHPFADANGRTFVNLLLNYLLLQEGFPPAIFFEPNIFDIHHDLANEIKKSIANTIEIYNGNTNLFRYNQRMETQAILEALNEVLTQHIHINIKRLDTIGADLFRREPESDLEKNKIIKTVSNILNDNDIFFAYYFLPESKKHSFHRMFQGITQGIPELAETINNFKNKNISELIQTNKINPLLIQRHESEIELLTTEKKSSHATQRDRLFSKPQEETEQDGPKQNKLI